MAVQVFDESKWKQLSIKALCWNDHYENDTIFLEKIEIVESSTVQASATLFGRGLKSAEIQIKKIYRASVYFHFRIFFYILYSSAFCRPNC